MKKERNYKRCRLISGSLGCTTWLAHVLAHQLGLASLGSLNLQTYLIDTCRLALVHLDPPSRSHWCCPPILGKFTLGLLQRYIKLVGSILSHCSFTRFTLSLNLVISLQGPIFFYQSLLYPSSRNHSRLSSLYALT